MQTVPELIRQYRDEQISQLNQLWDLGARARGAASLNVSDDVSKRLSQKERQALLTAEAAAAAEEERQAAKARYVELEAELLAAIELRAATIREELAPSGAGFSDYAAASKATPEALIATADMALASGDESVVRLVVTAALERDLETTIAHISDVREDIADKVAELAQAAALPRLDPSEAADIFEMWAQKPATADIARSRGPSDINVLGQIGTG
jgi:hypothetical protein